MEKWIQDAVKNEGRVRRYMKRVYGNRAFTKKGTIKLEYINKAIKRVKAKPTPNQKSLLSALNLAKRLKRYSKKKRKRRR